MGRPWRNTASASGISPTWSGPRTPPRCVGCTGMVRLPSGATRPRTRMVSSGRPSGTTGPTRSSSRPLSTSARLCRGTTPLRSTRSERLRRRRSQIQLQRARHHGLWQHCEFAQVADIAICHPHFFSGAHFSLDIVSGDGMSFSHRVRLGQKRTAYMASQRST
jgi:hypothetical protein